GLGINRRYLVRVGILAHNPGAVEPRRQSRRRNFVHAEWITLHDNPEFCVFVDFRFTGAHASRLTMSTTLWHFSSHSGTGRRRGTGSSPAPSRDESGSPGPALRQD